MYKKEAKLSKFPETKFHFELTVYLKDTNMFGNVYFSRYFEWQGMAREAYFQTVKDYKKILSSGIKLITKNASVIYKKGCYAFDEIQIEIQNRNVKRTTFEMGFTYTNKKTGELIATGEQTIGFADPNWNPILIPREILAEINKHR